MPRLRSFLLLTLLVLGLAAAVQATEPAPPSGGSSSNESLNKGRATIDPNG